MSKTISFRGGKAVASVFSSTGAAIPFPVFSLPAANKLIADDGAASAVYAAFTPSNTTVTINPTAENAITFTNATGREYLCTSNAMAGAYFFAATARRKPGTTASMAAQTVIVSVNSVEVGRFNVEAAAADATPRCGFVSFFNVSGDQRLETAANSITVGVTAADPELEIVLWAVGYQD